jgi:hypothetical protein
MRTDTFDLDGVEALIAATSGVSVGRIVQLADDGQALVDFPANRTGRPVKARSVVEGRFDPIGPNEVLLAFEHGNPEFPIILGILRDSFQPSTPSDEVILPGGRPRAAVIDGDRVIFSAKEEIQLRCGASSVTLRRDGRVVVRGSHIISQSSGLHRIKGAAVRIN